MEKALGRYLGRSSVLHAAQDLVPARRGVAHPRRVPVCYAPAADGRALSWVGGPRTPGPRGIPSRPTQRDNMFTRIVYLTLKTNAAPEFSKVLEQKIVPTLREEPGFQDELLLITAGGPDVVTISIWDSREDAENYARSAYPQVLRMLETLIEGTPR